jgi:peptidoglycan/xylan/chitin deacetylase (PgdA/CDA1 family)
MGIAGPGLRRTLKRGLAAVPSRPVVAGTTLLIYHRVSGTSAEELDLSPRAFSQQVDLLAAHRVVSLDTATDELEAGDDSPKVVLTFDDGYADVHEHAWPLLREAGLPFTIYVTTAYLGAPMRWEGSTARGEPGQGLSWSQLEELAASPLVTIANHTHTHARPEDLTAEELDRCSEELERRLGIVPRHFAYTWGVPTPHALPLLRSRFRSAATGQLGRNHPTTDPMFLHRVPVRGTDPAPFFAAKLRGGLGPERLYERIVGAAKSAGLG